MLTEAQVAQYTKDGYVIPDFHMDQGRLDAIRLLHKQLVENYPYFSDYCPALLPFDSRFLAFARDETILDMVSQVIGDDIALWNMSFFAKPAQVGSKTPWHQDGEYWAMQPLATCTVWLALDDSTSENGCLRVIPGSHQGNKLGRHQTNNEAGLSLNQELLPTEFDESEAVDLVMKAGQISLHDVYLVHGSEPNRSTQSRRGMTMRFMPTSAHYNRDIEKQQDKRSTYPWASEAELMQVQQLPIFLMRGLDRCGRNDYQDSFVEK